MKTILFSGALALSLSGPALANSCPKPIADAKTMAADKNLAGGLLVKFNKKIAEAQADHVVGKHAESVAAVKDALALLGM